MGRLVALLVLVAAIPSGADARRGKSNELLRVLSPALIEPSQEKIQDRGVCR